MPWSQKFWRGFVPLVPPLIKALYCHGFHGTHADKVPLFELAFKFELDVDAGFDILDEDGSGTITFDELVEAFKAGKF